MNGPLFIVGSGRSGTAALARTLSMYEGVNVHHEYLVNYVQPLAMQYYHGWINEKHAIERLWETHGAGYNYTDAVLWGDASNKLSWLIYPLTWLFPNAKFIQVVRDGRKVASSFYNKLGNEIYADADVELMRSWATRQSLLTPPIEKRYWWNLPPEEHDQFERICWHWRECHETIEGSFIEYLEPEQHKSWKLEDILDDLNIFADLVEFIGLDYNEAFFNSLKVPHNVSEPINYPLTDEQTKQFQEICGDSMRYYGYSGDEYDVKY